MFAACLGGGTMTVTAISIADPGDTLSRTATCNGHMGLGIVLQVIRVNSDSGPYRFAVTRTGTVSAAEFFVLTVHESGPPPDPLVPSV
jgi:hypothetical protein